ncbi:SEC11C [Symbiodinium sp. KB8]|nr:SEC11C [Symbiodinium sp. KB8]
MEYVKAEVMGQYTQLKELVRNPHQALFQVLNLAMVVFSALIIWKTAMVCTISESPVVVVLSGSMEPAFQRGDVLFLDNHPTRINVGEVVVYSISEREVPIVHRVLETHELSDGTVQYLTKGDNNRVDDRGLYAWGQRWLTRDEIVGRARWSVPYLGMVTILLNDYPWFKFVLLGVMGLFVLTSREQ